MYVVVFSHAHCGYCVYRRIDALSMTFHAGPFSELAAAESEAARLNHHTV